MWAEVLTSALSLLEMSFVSISVVEVDILPIWPKFPKRWERKYIFIDKEIFLSSKQKTL